MADAPMAPIEPLGIGAIQLPHALGQIRQGRFHQQMVMIVHQAIGMASPPKAIHDLGESIEKGLAVGLGFNDGLVSITPAGHVIQGMFKLETQGPGHARNVAILIVVLQDLTPNLTPNLI